VGRLKSEARSFYARAGPAPCRLVGKPEWGHVRVRDGCRGPQRLMSLGRFGGVGNAGGGQAPALPCRLPDRPSIPLRVRARSSSLRAFLCNAALPPGIPHRSPSHLPTPTGRVYLTVLRSLPPSFQPCSHSLESQGAAGCAATSRRRRYLRPRASLSTGSEEEQSKGMQACTASLRRTKAFARRETTPVNDKTIRLACPPCRRGG
jgi:hypothetical protein